MFGSYRDNGMQRDTDASGVYGKSEQQTELQLHLQSCWSHALHHSSQDRGQVATFPRMALPQLL